MRFFVVTLLTTAALWLLVCPTDFWAGIRLTGAAWCLTGAMCHAGILGAGNALRIRDRARRRPR